MATVKPHPGSWGTSDPTIARHDRRSNGDASPARVNGSRHASGSGSPSTLPAPEDLLSVEALQGILGGLVRERQRLRLASADRTTLEANRLAIVTWQYHLSRALIARHGQPCPPPS